MNLNISLTNNELFFQAINHPDTVEEDIILALIEKYPYAQSLRFVYERKVFGKHGSVQNLSSTLLYASSPSWLYEFVHSKSVVAPTPITQQDEVIIEERLNNDEGVVEIEEESVEVDELDRLIQAGVAKDYFRANEQQQEIIADAEAEEILIVTAALAESVAEESDGRERVSVYDDDTMPYSFLWWLHKTRLEYADTYQPYVKSPLGPMMPSNDDIAKIHEKLDTQLLDQQIRENIFHLQSPEAKLSDEVKTTIAFQIPRKTDEVIEKFIREEPMIQPLQAEKLDLENKARKSSEDQHSLVTETLAKIYVEQGLYPKAIEVYKKLVLKYPEKNAYFAARITELEKKLN
ncbi:MULTISPECIES: hypothetical protein [unclassified Sphingobacterium]|uniref:hypothetical protein n=1 Tax=unclassified Sphingobacterium TaxID=2609468 RepID=UPI0025F26876|nr:hypothetical protein [Sphingobacterium sp. UBA5670]